MEQRDWQGVFPAITTPFLESFEIDHARMAKNVAWLADNGCSGIVALGSLGEGASLSADEKISILETCKRALNGRIPLVAAIAGLTTAECVALAKRAAAVGCDGLMILPPYVYKGDWRETKTHFSAVIAATPLSCMLYNNPIAYGTDVTPKQLRELTATPHESSRREGIQRRRKASDSRSRSELRSPEHFRRHGRHDFGVDPDGCDGVGSPDWSTHCRSSRCDCSKPGRDGRMDEARALYEWFLPLLRLDTVVKFVQLIKLVQTEVGHGNAVVRPPRLELAGDELTETLTLIRERLAVRPTLS
jgi:4-hydroxy-tetrahydrodipicolinate synthase